MYLKDELLIMRENYHKKPLKNISLKRPSWVCGDMPLLSLYEKKQLLLQEGEVHYAHIVQANSNLFKFFPHKDFPAMIAYSLDPLVDELPAILKELANTLYQYKDQPLDRVPQQFREAARILTDEHDCSICSFIVTSKGRQAKVYLAPVVIHRKLLPSGVLLGGFLPVLAHKDCHAVMVLPKKYWSREYKRFWFARKL